MRTLHHSLCSVIPPHILEHIAEDRGHVDDATRTGASETLVQMKILASRHQEEVEVEEEEATEEEATEANVPAVKPRKRRNVYDAMHTQRLPGKIVMSEGTAHTSDVEVNEAYDGAGKTWDFFASVYGRNSIDNKGLRLNSTVHYGKHFDNAFWDGKQMVYGDGDGKLFTRFTAALDVIAHELTHGVTQYSSSLAYTGQTGALNEHISDAFGIMVKQATLGITAAESDWIIGEGIFGPTVNGKGIRSMAAPGTAYDDPVLGRDPQPAHMRGYVTTGDDNGGVHINSGIPNHAFYLAATAVGGPTWDVLGRIWYMALQHLAANADFQLFANTTLAAATGMFGSSGKVRKAVQQAWLDVGVKPVPGLVLRGVLRPPQPKTRKPRSRVRRKHSWPARR